MTRTTKMDRTIANIMINKDHFEIEDNGTLTTYTTWVIVDDESTQVMFMGVSKNETNMIQFRDTIAETVAKYRIRGKVVNPYNHS
jgi:hypothetical protein